MPTDISNSVGTARQFTPQPDASYQGRYAGVGANNVPAVSTYGIDSLAQNMVKLDAALQGYAVNHEKYLDAKGHQEAEDMVNGMSAEAIKSLNTIDAAQLEGYVDSTANPYFKAYADKLRGEFLSTQMKREYDVKYAMSPSRSMDEEAKRYADFSADWKKANLTDSNAPLNKYAFDMGFNENQLVNVNNLATAWEKKKNEDDVVVTMASAQSKLGSIIENSVELLKTNGAMTKTAQAVFNEARLMGLPAPYRQKLLDDWTHELIQTGHLDADKLGQMLKNINISASIDGTTTKASDLVDMQTLKTQCAEYQSQFLTKDAADWVQSCIDNEDSDSAFAKVEDMKKNDPDHAPYYAKFLPQIVSGIKAKQEERAREQEQEAKESNKNTAEYATARGCLDAWMDGADSYNGRPATDVSGVSKGTLHGLFQESIQYALTANPDMSARTRAKYIQKIMSFPGFNDFRSSLQKTYEYDFRNIRHKGDGSTPMSQTAQTLLAMYKSDTANFASIWGEELTSQVSGLNDLQNIYGTSEGLNKFASYNECSSEDKKAYESQIEPYSIGYTLGGVHILGGGSKTVHVNVDPNRYRMFKRSAVMYMSAGFGAVDAVNRTGAAMVQNMMEYHTALMPKGIYNNCHTTDDELYFKKALDHYIYNVGGSSPSDVRIDYKPAEGMFVFAGSNGSARMNLGEIRSLAYGIYKDDCAKYAKWKQSGGSNGNNYNVTPAQANAARQPGYLQGTRFSWARK